MESKQNTQKIIMQALVKGVPIIFKDLQKELQKHSQNQGMSNCSKIVMSYDSESGLEEAADSCVLPTDTELESEEVCMQQLGIHQGETTEDTMTLTKIQMMISEALWEQMVTIFNGMKKELQKYAKTQGMSKCSKMLMSCASGKGRKSLPDSQVTAKLTGKSAKNNQTNKE